MPALMAQNTLAANPMFGFQWMGVKEVFKYCVSKKEEMASGISARGGGKPFLRDTKVHKFPYSRFPYTKSMATKSSG